jgi:hypothetical protein
MIETMHFYLVGVPALLIGAGLVYSGVRLPFDGTWRRLRDRVGLVLVGALFLAIGYQIALLALEA